MGKSAVTEMSGGDFTPVPRTNGSALSMAQAALGELGYSQSEIAASLKGLKVDGMTTEEIIRHALRAMVMR